MLPTDPTTKVIHSITTSKYVDQSTAVVDLSEVDDPVEFQTFVSSELFSLVDKN